MRYYAQNNCIPVIFDQVRSQTIMPFLIKIFKMVSYLCGFLII